MKPKTDWVVVVVILVACAAYWWVAVQVWQ
jgi:hypothetical protein